MELSSLGIPTCYDKAIQYSSLIRPAAGHNVVTVLIVVSEARAVVAVKVTAQDSFVGLDIPLIRLRRTEPSVTTIQAYALDKLERLRSVPATARII